MNKKVKRKAALLSVLMMLGAFPVVTNVNALNPDDVLNDSLDDLQQTIVDYIMMKNYISGNISLSQNFREKLDYNNDGVVNILDSTRAKNKILDLSQKQNVTPAVTTTPSVSDSTVTTTDDTTTTIPITLLPITTEPTSTYLAYDGSLEVGCQVHYDGEAYYSSDGSGNIVKVTGTFKVMEILPEGSAKYTVRLDRAGWVSYTDVAGRVVNTVPGDPDTLKKGDMVEYEGTANTTADGTGKKVDVQKGLYKVINILEGTSYPYIVQLEGAGWVSYKDLTGKEPPLTTTQPPVTTAPVNTTVSDIIPVTTVPVTTVPVDDGTALKIGDKVQYSGEAYYAASGNGGSIKVDGVYVVEEILNNSKNPYTVRLKNAGWVSYEALTGKKQPVVTTALTTTAVTTTTTAPVTTTVTTTTTAKVFQKGDTVYYSGIARYTPGGNGKITEVSGNFIIDEIKDASEYTYNVNLRDAGWVKYDELREADKSATLVTEIKKGDKVKYSGKAYYSASGEGDCVEIPYGTYTVLEVLENSSYPYTVRLDKAGWVSYKSLTSFEQSNDALKYDGKTYKLRNSGTGKHLTAGGTENKSNVYQYSESSEKSQKFRFELYGNNDDYRIYVSDGKVLDIVKTGSDEIVSGCNVQIYDHIDPEAQVWKIVEVTPGKYKIASSTNPDVVLTSNGFSNGTDSGKAIASPGNVYLMEYQELECQIWLLEEIK